MPPPGPVSPTTHAVVHGGATVVVVVATVVVVEGTVVVVVAGTVVVVDVDALVIVFVDVFAGNLPDLAIFNVNTHEPVEPIVNFVGLLLGVNVQLPVFDHVFTPREFDVATADSFFTWPAVKDDTFHLTVVDRAAATELAVTPPNKAATSNTTTTARPRTPGTQPNITLLLTASTETKHPR